MDSTKWLIAALMAGLAIAADAMGGERSNLRDPVAVAAEEARTGRSPAKDAVPIDWVVSAVDGAESSHGRDRAMWRPDPSGPQGPMQVTAAAATDVGGGDRFDLFQNREIGRAYLQQLFWRYGNWPDAIAAYNWGMGKMDAWVKAGRPSDKLLVGVAAYLRRVLHESGLCNRAQTGPRRQMADTASEPASSRPDSLLNAACSGPDVWAGTYDLGSLPSRFSRSLDQGLQLALQRAAQAR